MEPKLIGHVLPEDVAAVSRNRAHVESGTTDVHAAIDATALHAGSIEALRDVAGGAGRRDGFFQQRVFGAALMSYQRLQVDAVQRRHRRLDHVFVDRDMPIRPAELCFQQQRRHPGSAPFVA